MITTLLRHEFRRTRWMLGIIFGGALVLTLTGAALAWLGWPVLDTLGLVIASVSIAALMPVVNFALAVDYWRTSYQRQGYLTQTLPIRSRTIYGAKLTWALLASLAAMVWSLALLAILWPVTAGGQGLEPNPFVAVGRLWQSATEVASPLFLVQGIALIVLSLLAYVPMWFAAVSIGSEQRFHRLGGIGGPVLVFAILYGAMQALFAIGIFAIPFAIGLTDGGGLGVIAFDVMAQINGPSEEFLIPLGFFPMIFLVAGWAIWRTGRSWRRKVALA